MSFFAVVRGTLAEFRTVVVVFRNIFAGFYCSGDRVWPSGPLQVPFRSVCCDKSVCALLKFAFFVIFSRIFVFFRGGSNMVAFRAKVDGKWQALFQWCLRYRVAGLRPSGFPNLPFSLFSPFHLAPPLLSLFPILSPFSLFPSFFFFFPQFSSNFPSPSPTFRFSSRFWVKATRLHVTPLSTMCSTRHRILRRTRHVVKEDFAGFSAFSGTFKKRVPIR